MPEHGKNSGSTVHRRRYLQALGTGAVAAFAGCADTSDPDTSGGGGGGGNGNNGGTQGGTQSSGEDMSFKVGVITSQSGSYSFLGKGEVQGAKLAKADLEEEYGVDIELVTADTETDPGTGLERMKRLVNEDQVDFTLGGVSSSVAIKMGNWASDNGVAYMAAGSHSDATTGGKCAANMFRPTCSNSMLANALGTQMADYADSWFVMFADYTWGQTGAKAIKGALKANGAEIKGEVGTPFPSQDYTQYLNEAANSGADGLAVVIAGTDQRIVTKQFLNKGLDQDMKMAGPLFEESVFWGIGKEAASAAGLWATPWAASSPATDLGESVKQRVASEFGASPFSRHFMGYTSMDQLTRAAIRAGSKDAADIRGELEGHELEHKLKQGKMYFRADDHQLIQPVSTVEAKAQSNMQDDPYKSWFEHTSKTAGDEVARDPSETGCSL
ncbi:ABC transporter substrate-binding protein [Haloarchaeobius amylolyticus]|uniref:ABC transporter substrate-binding protein n=1 Tax=Haloarchaeobius amylolyticus TaxID=1198296 RepID=UPI0022718BDB|nr:ABC transporter substrate-binding protein [Haloarchaeobius amylolyticus]